MNSKVDNLLRFLNETDSTKGISAAKKKLISFAFTSPYINFSNLINNLQAAKTTFFFWQKPDEECSVLGFGELFSVNEYGFNRAELSKKEIEKWIDNYYSNLAEYNLQSTPLFMGGMKFSPEGESDKSIWNDFADSDWFIPETILLKRNQQVYIIHNFVKEDHSDEELISLLNQQDAKVEKLKVEYIHDKNEIVESSNLYALDEKNNWIKKVNSALEQIKSGAYKKVVLSRRVSLLLSQEPVLYNKLKSLANDYPKCYIFAYGKKDSVFFGASPEKLAKISNGWVEADALAGSIPRGKDKIEDEKLANELLQSKKNINEQFAVVEFITNSFSSFTDEIVYDDKPTIRKLSNIQHLWTPIKAKLKPGNTVFSILKEIHPTPAICGVPWSGALDFIRATEGYNRGLYAGIIGWFNFNQQGEFAVSIRSALLKRTELYAFAGCGIVEGSDPEQEFEETELKLKPILSLFPHENICQS